MLPGLSSRGSRPCFTSTANIDGCGSEVSPPAGGSAGLTVLPLILKTHLPLRCKFPIERPWQRLHRNPHLHLQLQCNPGEGRAQPGPCRNDPDLANGDMHSGTRFPAFLPVQPFSCNNTLGHHSGRATSRPGCPCSRRVLWPRDAAPWHRPATWRHPSLHAPCPACPRSRLSRPLAAPAPDAADPVVQHLGAPIPDAALGRPRPPCRVGLGPHGGRPHRAQV